MIRRAAVSLLAALAACSGPPVFQSPSGAYTFTPPGSWAGHFQSRVLGPNEGPGPYEEGVDFLYPPQDSTMRPQVLLRLVVYRDSAWAALLAEGGPPPGEEVRRLSGGRVLIVGLPQSNPFPASRDSARFQGMTIDLDRVRRAVTAP